MDNNNIDIDPLLEVFLIETHSYDKFVKNVSDTFRYAISGKIIAIDSLAYGFNWKDSKEGYAYWSDLSTQFEHLNNY